MCLALSTLLTEEALHHCTTLSPKIRGITVLTPSALRFPCTPSQEEVVGATQLVIGSSHAANFKCVWPLCGTKLRLPTRGFMQCFLSHDAPAKVKTPTPVKCPPTATQAAQPKKSWATRDNHTVCQGHRVHRESLETLMTSFCSQPCSQELCFVTRPGTQVQRSS